MRQTLEVGEVTFILCYIVPLDKRYFIPGEEVLIYWDRWQQNKGKRGFNFIQVQEREEVKSNKDIILDYLDKI